jgi:hypothetical protein
MEIVQEIQKVMQTPGNQMGELFHSDETQNIGILYCFVEGNFSFTHSTISLSVNVEIWYTIGMINK